MSGHGRRGHGPIGVCAVAACAGRGRDRFEVRIAGISPRTTHLPHSFAPIALSNLACSVLLLPHSSAPIVWHCLAPLSHFVAVGHLACSVLLLPHFSAPIVLHCLTPSPLLRPSCPVVLSHRPRDTCYSHYPPRTTPTNLKPVTRSKPLTHTFSPHNPNEP